MPEDVPGGLGHNNPPDEARAALAAKVDEFGATAVKWGEAGVETQADADRLNDFLAGARTLRKQIDDARVAEKRPHDEAAKAVQAKFKPLLDAVASVEATAKKILNSFLEREEARRREEERKARERAAQEEAAARERQRQAEEEGRLVAAKEAEEAATKAAERAEEEREVKVRARSASGAGRTMSQRTYRSGKIVNVPMCLAHFKDHDAIREALQQVVNQTIRAAKGEDIKIPGVEIIEERRL